VPVDVQIDEPLDADRDDVEYVRPRSTHGIGRDELESRDTLVHFLEDITRAESGNETVRTLCLAHLEPLLLERLGVSYPVPNPVVVELPADV